MKKKDYIIVSVALVLIVACFYVHLFWTGFLAASLIMGVALYYFGTYVKRKVDQENEKFVQSVINSKGGEQ